MAGKYEIEALKNQRRRLLMDRCWYGLSVEEARQLDFIEEELGHPNDDLAQECEAKVAASRARFAARPIG